MKVSGLSDGAKYQVQALLVPLETFLLQGTRSRWRPGLLSWVPFPGQTGPLTSLALGGIPASWAAGREESSTALALPITGPGVSVDSEN